MEMAGRARHKIVQISPPLVPDRDDAGGVRAHALAGLTGNYSEVPHC